MNAENLIEARHALKEAQEEFRRGQKGQAYWWAARAARLAPELEEPWLLLASVAGPQASVGYLQRALEINPANQRAVEGLAWARQQEKAWRERQVSAEVVGVVEDTARVALKSGHAEPGLPPQPRGYLPSRRDSRLVSALPYVAALFVVCVAMLGVAAAGFFSLLNFSTPTPVHAAVSPPAEISSINLPSAAQPLASKPLAVQPPADTPTPPATETAVPTQGPTETPLPPPTETAVPVVMPTFINVPKSAQLPGVSPKSYADPAAPGGNHAGRWIDVNLSHQMVYAYEGKKVVRSFVVSTGVAAHPTVTGQYRIWIKLRADDMKGPGYNLKDVPYVMYFYKGYSLHGTYWHHNFGTPMSHGCVNMYTPDAAWLYGWSSVGTLVNVHY